MFLLAWRSLLNRKIAVTLTVLSVALSVALFLGVEKVRQGTREGFNSTISGAELIIGARSGPINLLLYSVFRLGDATAEISWPTYQLIAERTDIEWTVPLSLGDSHRGFRVLGTTEEYFQRYKFAGGRLLEFSEGQKFDDLFDAVIGAEVAKELKYSLESRLVLTHGLAGFSDHDNRPFRVVGILKRTGTPIDRTVHVSLEAISAIHVGWETGAKNPYAERITEEMIRSFDLTPKSVTAVLAGLERKGTILRTQRAINTYPREALMAIIPGKVLADLWQITGIVERALIGLSIFVIAVGLVSILTSILTSLNERRREMSLLRAIGATPVNIFTLMVAEAGVLGFIGAVLGSGLINSLLLIVTPILSERFGILLLGIGLSSLDVLTILTVTITAFVVGSGPAIVAVRRSLQDGLNVHI